MSQKRSSQSTSRKKRRSEGDRSPLSTAFKKFLEEYERKGELQREMFSTAEVFGPIDQVENPQHSCKIVSFFNHKGGVGKTTNLITTAWALVRLGQRVLVVDGDSQMNATQQLLQYSRPDISQFVDGPAQSTLLELLRDAKLARPFRAHVIKMKMSGFDGVLYLLRGHPDMESFSEDISIQYGLLDLNLAEPKRVPRAFGLVMAQLAARLNLNTALVDLSPSIGAFNRLVLMNSDGFLVPMGPDLFSKKAISALSEYFPKWAEEFDNSNTRLAKYGEEFLMRNKNFRPKFLGAILTRFSYGAGQVPLSHNMLQAITEIQHEVRDKLLASLRGLDMLLPDEFYQVIDEVLKELSLNPQSQGTVGHVIEYHQLGQIAQRTSRPVIYLVEADLNTLNGKSFREWSDQVELALENNEQPPPQPNNILKPISGKERDRILKRIKTIRKTFETIACIVGAFSQPAE